MDDGVFKEIISNLGDRVAIKHFCKSLQPSTSSKNSESKSRKEQLLENMTNSLKRKLLERGQDKTVGQQSLKGNGIKKTGTVDRSVSFCGNTNARKDTRKVSIGWVVTRIEVADDEGKRRRRIT